MVAPSHAALAALDDGIVYVVDLDGRITYAGGATQKTLGYRPDERVGRLALDCVYADDAASVSSGLAQCAADPSGAPHRLQCRVYTRDRQLRWLDVTFRNRLQDPAIGGIVIRARDVTCDREVEAHHLRRGELLDALQAAIFNSALGFWEWDTAADRLRWLNDWPREHGLPPCDGDGHHARLLATVDPAHHARLREGYRSHVAGTTPRFDAEFRVRALDGAWRWLATRARIVDRDEAGRPLRVVGTAFDIDGRKRLEEALERRHRQFEATAANVPTWLVLTDPALHVEFINRPAFGREPADVVGRPLAEVIGAEAAEVFGRHHRLAIERRQPVSFTGTLDRGQRVLECRLAPVIVDDAVIGVAANVTEVTDRLALERAVLEISSREQRRFGSDLHDGLGQELTGIALNLSSLLRRAESQGSPLAADVAELVGYANGAIDTARKIARGVSPFTRAQGGLRRALEDLVQRMTTGDGPAVRCAVGAYVPEDLDPLVAEHLYRIVQEAVANAVRHAGATEVKVRLDVDATAGVLHLSIGDDGRGIGKAAEFAPGLGLKIMRYRAEQIGGTLRIRAGAQRGTRIDCLCPLRTDAATLGVPLGRPVAR